MKVFHWLRGGANRGEVYALQPLLPSFSICTAGGVSLDMPAEPPNSSVLSGPL